MGWSVRAASSYTRFPNMARALASFSLRELALLRLRNQRLILKSCKSPEEVVGWLGAVQAQDYYGAKWAVAQRTKSVSDAAVEQAFADGRILRTHVLRPTWHFVLPADIRFMLELTAPRIRAAMRYYDRQLGIDEAELGKSHAVVRAALRGGRQATRSELARLLNEAGIEAKGQRLGHLLSHAELDALICSGPRRGKQFTYALLDERAPKTKPRTREDALAELSLRFYTGHGPALLQDFAWWSGLTLTDAKKGLDSVRDHFSELEAAGRSYWHRDSAKPPVLKEPVVHFLPNYDEHLIAYKERSAAFDRERIAQIGTRGNVLFNHLVILDGRVIGGWRREQGETKIEITLITRLNAAEKKALGAAEARLTKYLEASADE